MSTCNQIKQMPVTITFENGKKPGPPWDAYCVVLTMTLISFLIGVLALVAMVTIFNTPVVTAFIISIVVAALVWIGIAVNLGAPDPTRM